ncbi:MAG: M17 family metallopeptidase [Salinibacter sp.]
MTVSTTAEAPVDLDVDLLLLPFTTAPPVPFVEALVDTLGAAVDRAVQDFEAEQGAARVIYPEHTTAPRVAFLGLGPASDLDAEALRMAGAAGADVALDHEAESVACLLPVEEAPEDARTTQGLVEGFVLGAYRYRRYKTADGFDGPSAFLMHVGEDHDEEAVATGIERGERLADGACTARDLVNRSPDEKTARQLAEAVAQSGASHGYRVETWDEDRIRDEGMGGLLAVNRGSFDPPTFSILTWNPDEAVNDRPIVLAGKGVVFDTGGLSLKDTKDSMDMMKADMGGAAAVIGVFEALADLNVPLHVVGLLPATDNRPGRKAYVPGDVVRMHSGTTVEVMNTDAEGRLLLADALSYATDAYEPEAVVDLATLTGSCIIALGQAAAGVMTSETDDAAERLYAIQRAGERTGERVHPLPMYDEYGEHLESEIADLKNVGGRKAGAVTAGKFLEHFVGDSPWLHLDIAGPAFRKSAESYEPQGGTGFGVRLVVDFLRNYVLVRERA